MADLTVLDCTLRDGGYYNNWDFDDDLIFDYLSAMENNNIAFVEIGFRSLINNKFSGLPAFTPDSFLDALDFHLNFGVMINGAELLTGNMESILTKLFPKVGNDTKIKLVRIACHFHEFDACLPAVTWLKKNGFKVGFNLMQISERLDLEIIELGRNASKFDIDVLYFADSMGCMTPSDVENTARLFRTYWHGDLGIHTHDNLGLALSNTLKAIEIGITWVDCTLTGMGRGPGNAKTEELMIELSSEVDSGILSLFDCITRQFKTLQNTYKWGKNEYYYLSGKLSIHPSYIQFMLADERYDSKDIVAVINFLKDNGGSKFSKENIIRALGFYSDCGIGSDDTVNIPANDILIVGTGPSVDKYRNAIHQFIGSRDLTVIALNSRVSLPEECINYRIASHPLSIMADIQKYKELTSTLITPYSMLPSEVAEQLDRNKVFDYGIGISDNQIDITNNLAKIPNSFVLTYALAFSLSVNPAKIYLVGFDGYSDSLKNEENNQIFKSFSGFDIFSKTLSLTPTKYNIPTASLYGLL